MTSKNECHHGSLRRSCDRCDLDQGLDAYFKHIEWLIETHQEQIAEFLKMREEIDRLSSRND